MGNRLFDKRRRSDYQRGFCIPSKHRTSGRCFCQATLSSQIGSRNQEAYIPCGPAVNTTHTLRAKRNERSGTMPNSRDFVCADKKKSRASKARPSPRGMYHVPRIANSGCQTIRRVMKDPSLEGNINNRTVGFRNLKKQFVSNLISRRKNPRHSRIGSIFGADGRNSFPA